MTTQGKMFGFFRENVTSKGAFWVFKNPSFKPFGFEKDFSDNTYGLTETTKQHFRSNAFIDN